MMFHEMNLVFFMIQKDQKFINKYINRKKVFNHSHSLNKYISMIALKETNQSRRLPSKHLNLGKSERNLGYKSNLGYFFAVYNVYVLCLHCVMCRRIINNLKLYFIKIMCPRG